jgi:hypothetical protein
MRASGKGKPNAKPKRGWLLRGKDYLFQSLYWVYFTARMDRIAAPIF